MGAVLTWLFLYSGHLPDVGDFVFVVKFNGRVRNVELLEVRPLLSLCIFMKETLNFL
jgi:hypothetical protein